MTLTLKPIAKKVTFEIADADVTKTKKKDDGTTVKVTAKELDISEKAFIPFTALCLVYYMLQKPMGYSISSRSVISKIPALPTMTATGFSFTSIKVIRRKNISEWYVSFF